MYQNQWEYGTSLNWVKGKHTISAGVTWDYTQLNIINHNTDSDVINFKTFTTFVEGTTYSGTTAFAGSANRYYRSNTVGAYVNDNYKILSNLTLTLGLRYDYDGPLWEKYGRLTSFDSKLYAYNAATDTITGSGLEFAGNNSQFATPGASKSLMNQNQWGFAPRIGLAWSPLTEGDRPHRLRHVLRSRRVFLRTLAQRGQRLQWTVWRHPGAALRNAYLRGVWGEHFGAVWHHTAAHATG